MKLASSFISGSFFCFVSIIFTPEKKINTSKIAKLFEKIKFVLVLDIMFQPFFLFSNSHVKNPSYPIHTYLCQEIVFVPQNTIKKNLLPQQDKPNMTDLHVAVTIYDF